MKNQILRKKVEKAINEKDNFYNLSLIEQVKYIAYFYIRVSGERGFTSSTISDLFEDLDLPIPRNIQDLLNKLSSKNKGILIKNKGGFKFSRKEFKDIGKELILDKDLIQKDFVAIHISGKKSWTDRNKKFSEFLKNLKGEIIIVDSYYGLGSFHVLDNFENRNVRFLTAKLGNDENQEKINKELRRFKREFPKIKLRKYSRFWELHDRYILSEDMIVWVGHGIKDFGDKECFLIGISIDKVLDIVKNLKSEFEERWAKSNNLI